MDEDLIRTAFEQWTRGLDPVRARIALFEHVRDLPYCYPASRDPIEVLTTGRGSCSGKHYLLGQLFRHLGLPVRHMLCTHRFNESPLPFPEEMQAVLRRNEIMDVHDYLQIAVGDSWIDVDATWELGLREFGFPVTDGWDGKSSVLLTVIPDEQIQVNGDPAKAKDEVLARLTPRQRALRRQFLEALSKWVEELAAEIPPGS
jgi:hypothetical protein